MKRYKKLMKSKQLIQFSLKLMLRIIALQYVYMVHHSIVGKFFSYIVYLRSEVNSEKKWAKKHFDAVFYLHTAQKRIRTFEMECM